MGGVKIELSKKASSINDYKFFCFNGEAKIFKVDIGRFENHHANYYSRDGKLLPFHETIFPQNKHSTLLPDNLEEMLILADRLSSKFPFIRVDFYNVNKHIYISELTFYPASGFGSFHPEKYDRYLGDFLALPI